MVTRGEFDYAKYLASKNIYGSIASYSAKKINENKGNIILKYIYGFRETVSKKIDKELSKNSASLLKGMIYGDITSLDEDIKNNFINIGISHLTAVSGSNVSTLIIIFTIIFSKTNMKKIKMDILIIVIISIFCVISSLELSIVRATIMTSILVISKLVKKEISIYQTLILTITVIIIINPMSIFNVGLLLSFTATLSIVMFTKPTKECIDKKLHKKMKSTKILKYLNFLVLPFSVTLSANILILPITIVFFNKFPAIFLVSNVIASYLETGIRVLGTIAIVAIKIPVLSTILFQTSGILCNVLIYIAKILNKISMVIYFRSPTILFIILYYLCVLIVYIKIEAKKNKLEKDNVYIIKAYKFIKKIENKIKKINLEKILILILLTYILILKIYYMFFDNYIYFLNVGQGDMAVIKTIDSFGLVDIGSTKKGLAASTLKSFMICKNIKKIDYIIISHMHTDHINGLIETIKNYKVSFVIYSYPFNKNNPEYLELLNFLHSNNIKTIMVETKDEIAIGKKLNINILLSGQGEIIDKDMENGNSIILEIISNNKWILFMGDATKTSESILLKCNMLNNKDQKHVFKDIGLKVGHHGSKTSTSKEFINKINFSFAIISSEKEAFGHPSEETLETLKNNKVKIYITEESGAIKYSLNK